MDRARFQRVVSELTSVASGDDSTAMETLERMILDHEPKCLTEAVSMLDVIIPEVETGGRSDGRDVRALHSIRSFLAS